MDCNKNEKKEKKRSLVRLVCCKVFISETRNSAALESIEQAGGRNPESVIVNKCEDREYNRVRYTLVSYVLHGPSGSAVYSPLHQTVIAMAEAAYAAVNLHSHSGTHPRLGVLDDVLFHPLARASLDDAAWLAKAVAKDIATKFQVPVYLYAAAHPTGKALDIIRRELGYYTPNLTESKWAGWTIPETLPERPDEGPEEVSPERGICTVGARPWVGLYNVPIMSTDLETTRRIALKVSARGGGLPMVQTLGLLHGKGSTEVACMLLEPSRIGADKVQRYVEMLAAREGIRAKKGYFTDFSPEIVIQKYAKLTSRL